MKIKERIGNIFAWGSAIIIVGGIILAVVFGGLTVIDYGLSSVTCAENGADRESSDPFSREVICKKLNQETLEIEYFKAETGRKAN